MSNLNMHKAKKIKNDEFFTFFSDIEKEMEHYKEHFKGKTILLPCDDKFSEFFNYFYINFTKLGIKKLIRSHRDFRSDEVKELFKEADIIITNPPFSLFREFVDQIIEYKKEFLIIGNIHAITYKNIFALIKNNQLWLGHSFIKQFKTNDRRVGAFTYWYTNLKTSKFNEQIISYKKYNDIDYPKYDNYDAINVDKTKEIPLDYMGEMGVPISFMYRYNPKQFEIIALGIVGSIKFTKNIKMEILKNGIPIGKFTKNAKGTLYRKYNFKKDKFPAFKNVETGELYSSIFARIIIKRRKI